MSSTYTPDYSHSEGKAISFVAVIWGLLLVIGVTIYFAAMHMRLHAESYGLSWQDIGAILAVVGIMGMVFTIFLDAWAETVPYARHVNAEWHPDKTSAPTA